ncbi:serine/threonine-protein kinase [Streptomyces griseosporeus]|uniref:serine/threonine-protein kinase n=1 Tax=Streptomyces griseosporeus TaxID=1910 RepID=UPI0036FC4232
MRELAPEDPQRLGPIELTARLGEGGMGQVYLGLSPGGRRVAVKTVRAEIAADPRFRERFRREVEAAQRVGGFWTATVVEADPDADVPWVASDYIDAPDMAQRVSREGPLTERDARRLAIGLAEALWSIHRAGLVHRDLKPSNVLVTHDGPRLIDFGIAKAVEGAPALTSTGHVIGTPGFMSPEQAGGERVGELSDIFPFGSNFVYATTGVGPFGEGSAPALLYRVVHDEPRLDAMPTGLLLEARARRLTPGGAGLFLSVECEVLRVHADERIVVPGTHHIDPALGNPLIYNFRHYHGLAPEVGHGFRSETANRAAGEDNNRRTAQPV